MDLSLIIGIIIGITLIITAIGWKSGATFFLDLNSLLIVLGGTLGATFINFPVSQIIKTPKRLLKAISTKKRVPYDDIELIVELSVKAKKRGRLFLMSVVPEIKDEFMMLGLQMYIDEVETDQIEYILREHLYKISKRHQQGIIFFEEMAKYAPGFGLLGTLIGLVLMLGNLKNPDTIGPNMAVALVTTFYGVLLAQLIFTPLAGRLKMLSAEEIYKKEMIIEGILAMSREEIPSIVKEKMELFLSLHERKKSPKRFRSASE